MTKIKIGDIVESITYNKYLACEVRRTGIVVRRIDAGGVDDIKGRYFCVRSFEDDKSCMYKIKVLKLLS